MGEQETAARNFFEAGGKYRLAEAVKRLMARQSLEDITVKEITGEAGVSRQTFYRHFLDKYDLVNWYFDELLANSFREMGYGRTIYEGLVRKFRYIQAEKVFFRAAFQSVQQNNLKDHDFRKIYGFYQDLYRKKTGKTWTWQCWPCWKCTVRPPST